MNNIKILCFERIDDSEEIGVDNTSNSKEFGICHYWSFLNKGFKDVYEIDVMIY